MDKLKEPDPKKNRNTFIVDFDKTLEILIAAHTIMLHRQKGYVQDLFSAMDVNLLY